MSENLEQLIGKQGEVEGRRVEIIEILHATGEVILREIGKQSALIENQYGTVTGRTHETFTIPFRSTISDGCHPVLVSILTLEEQNRLLEIFDE